MIRPLEGFRLMVALAVALVVSMSATTAAEVAKEIRSIYRGNGTWTVSFGPGPNLEIKSKTPDARGFRIRPTIGADDAFLLQENFDDGARFTIYEKSGNGLKRIAQVDGVLPVWKLISSQTADGLLFVSDLADYADIDTIVRSPNLFLSVKLTQPSARSTCGFRAPARVLKSWSEAHDKNTSYGEFVFKVVSRNADIRCRRSN